jgi:hypothetical protein
LRIESLANWRVLIDLARDETFLQRNIGLSVQELMR